LSAAAELFVEEVVTVAEALGISALVLSLVLAPLATELPERLNSVLWMRRDKDTLAVGNITVAMAFQSTVPIALGLAVTDWDLDRFAVAAGVAGLAGGALVLWRLREDRLGIPAVAASSALFAGFVAFAALGSGAAADRAPLAPMGCSQAPTRARTSSPSSAKRLTDLAPSPSRMPCSPCGPRTRPGATSIRSRVAGFPARLVSDRTGSCGR
jgi:hypothetical protein